MFYSTDKECCGVFHAMANPQIWLSSYSSEASSLQLVPSTVQWCVVQTSMALISAVVFSLMVRVVNLCGCLQGLGTILGGWQLRCLLAPAPL